MLLKKVDPNWFPNENPLIKEGELIDFTPNAEVLLAEKTVEEAKVKCPVCTFESSNTFEFASHVYNTHPKGVEEVKIEAKVEAVTVEIKPVEVKKEFKDMTDEEKKAWRLENLRRGKEIARAKQQAKKETELTQDAVKKVVAETIS